MNRLARSLLGPNYRKKIDNVIIQAERLGTTALKGRPLMSLRIWGPPRESAFRVELFESGDLVVRCTQVTRLRLSAEQRQTLFDLAEKAAVSDFCPSPHETAVNGTNADMEVVMRTEDGAKARNDVRRISRLRVICRDSRTWPRGEHTAALLREINRHLSTRTRARVF